MSYEQNAKGLQFFDSLESVFWAIYLVELFKLFQLTYHTTYIFASSFVLLDQFIIFNL